MATVKLARGLEQQYQSATKDADTLYICTDSGNIYLGQNNLFEPGQFISVSSAGKTLTFVTHGAEGVNGQFQVELDDMMTQQEITEMINTYLGSAFRYMGTVTNFTDLPDTGNNTGDLWHVINAYDGHPADSNYVWNGSGWDYFGGAVDLSNYVTKVSGATSGNFPVLNASGQIVNSSYGPNSFKTIQRQKPSPSSSGTGGIEFIDTIQQNANGELTATKKQIRNASAFGSGLLDQKNFNKLSSIEYGANVNVQSDWNVVDSNSDAFIKNKPSIPDDNDLVHKSINGEIISGQKTFQSMIVASTGINMEGTSIRNLKYPESDHDAANKIYVDTQISASSPDWEAAVGANGYIDNKPMIKSGAGTNSIIEGNLDNMVALGEYSHCEGNGREYELTVSGDPNARVYSTSSTNILNVGLVVRYGDVYAKIVEITGTNFTLDKTLSPTGLTGQTAYVIKGIAYSEASHSEGDKTTASGDHSHAEGNDTISYGVHSHAEGGSTIALGQTSHSEGSHTIAMNKAEHAQGKYNCSHTDTSNTALMTINSIGIGDQNGRLNAIEVMQNGDVYVYGVGGYNGTNPSRERRLQANIGGGSSVTPDWEAESGISGYIDNKPSVKAGEGICSVTQGLIEGVWSGSSAVASNGASGNYSHAEGGYTKSDGVFSHAEGIGTIAAGDHSHSEGYYTKSLRQGAHSEGSGTIAYGMWSHSEGEFNQSSIWVSNVDNPEYPPRRCFESTEPHGLIKGDFVYLDDDSYSVVNTIQDEYHFSLEHEISTQPIQSQLLFIGTGSIGNYSHSEGYCTKALGYYSHSEGQNTIAKNMYEHASGTYNVSHDETLFSVGCGDSSNRCNAIEITTDGQVYIQGIGGYTGTSISSSTKSVQAVISELIQIINGIQNLQS